MQTKFRKPPKLEKQTKTRKALSKRGKLILFSCLGLVVALLASGALYAYSIWSNPAAYLRATPTPSPSPSPSPTPSPTPLPDDTSTPAPTPTPSPTPDPYDVLMSQADLSMLKDTFNVALIGVDYAPERETWDGKHAYHADVIIVLAINFEDDRVDMISIPRDTYAKIPDVNGKYKINASLDCGGGLPNGFGKVCEAASWMLGGIPVDYYYAVTMPAVKELVNAIGGVTYDVDVDFTMNGRSYKKGEQYMDGQAVLDYLRVRKNVAQPGDQNRINRQKKMLVKIFQTIKEKNLLTQIPGIINAFNGQLYTNMSLEQTAALAVYAYKTNPDDIYMHSMGGSSQDIYNWTFVITDQAKRVDLIKEIYGVDVPQNKKYSLSYCRWEWQHLLSDVYLENAEVVLAAAKTAIEADMLLNTPTPSPSPSPTPSPDVSPTPAESPTPAPPETTVPADSPTPVVTPTPLDSPTPAASPSADVPDATATPAVPTPAAAEGGAESGQNADRPSGAQRLDPQAYTLYEEVLEDVQAVKKLYNAIKTEEKAIDTKSGTLRDNADALAEANAKLKEDVTTLARLVGYSKTLRWKVTLTYDIAVDFR